MAEVAVVSNVEKPVPVPEPEAEVAEKPIAEEEKVQEAVKEEVKVVPMDLQKKALEEFKALVLEALKNHEFSPTPTKAEPEEKAMEGKSDVVAAAASELANVEEKTSTPPPVATETDATVVKETVVSTAVDDDGAKTVEAIEETVVSVSSIPAEQEQPVPIPPAEPEQEEKSPEQVSIWGIPLLVDERSDALLTKFLLARDFKPKEALAMLKKTVQWRKNFDIEGLLEQNLENPSLEKFSFLDGFSKSGNPVCYNKFGVFQDKEIYKNTFSDAEKRKEFLKWRVQLLEKSIRKMLNFSPGGVCTFVQVNDFKNSPILLKKELRMATNEGLQLLQDNYPEFVSIQVFINVPWWYVTFMMVINPFLTQRTKSKFVFVGPAKSTETLFKYIAPEQVPVEYGGFSKEGEQEFTTADPVTKEIIKPSSTHTIELPFSEACNSLWEVRVNGWDVSYGAEFVPNAEDGFTLIVQKLKKITQSEESVINGSFKVDGPGKIVLTFKNQTSKTKKLFYRCKTKPSAS